MALIALDPHSNGVVLSETDFQELIIALDLYAGKFEGLLRTVMLAYVSASRTPEGRKAFQPIEHWIRENYIDIRQHLPHDLKRLYLSNIAFPPRNDT